jgi:hypothetical protein
MAEDVEQHITELTWLVDELQDEIEVFDTYRHTSVHRMLTLNLTDAIIRRAFLLRKAVTTKHRNTTSLSERELIQLLGEGG